MSKARRFFKNVGKGIKKGAKWAYRNRRGIHKAARDASRHPMVRDAVKTGQQVYMQKKKGGGGAVRKSYYYPKKHRGRA